MGGGGLSLRLDKRPEGILLNGVGRGVGGRRPRRSGVVGNRAATEEAELGWVTDIVVEGTEEMTALF